MSDSRRIYHRDWDLYDTRHVVFQPARLEPRTLEEGYWRAYRDFYRWGSIWRAAATKEDTRERARHIAYAAGWKKLEPFWDVVIRTRQVLHALPLLELVLSSTSRPRKLEGDRCQDLGLLAEFAAGNVLP